MVYFVEVMENGPFRRGIPKPIDRLFDALEYRRQTSPAFVHDPCLVPFELGEHDGRNNERRFAEPD